MHDRRNSAATIATSPALPRGRGPVSSSRIDRILEAPALPWLFVALGVAARLQQYAFNRSLWWDEASLALNLVDRSYMELLVPLLHNQAAPVGFLWAVRLCIDLLGDSEYVLRLVPLLAGIASLFLVLELARTCLAPRAVWLAVALAAATPHLLYFAGELKQYSSDVMFALMLTLIAIRIEEVGSELRRVAIFGLLGAVALWVSHSAAFVVAGITLVLGIRCVRTRDHRGIIALGIVGAVSLANLGLDYSLSLQEISARSEMLDFWSGRAQAEGAPPGGAFMPLPPVNLAELAWFPKSFFKFFQNPVGLTSTVLGAFCFVVGFAAMVRARTKHLSLLVAPAALALIVSGLEMFPFDTRLILFLVPAALILIAEGSETIQLALAPRVHKSVALVVPLMLIFSPAWMLARGMHSGYAKIETRPLIETLAEARQPGELVYVYHGSANPFLYYAPRYGFSQSDYLIGAKTMGDRDAALADLDRIRGQERVWVLASSSHDDEVAAIFEKLETTGRVVDTARAPHAELHLFSFDAKAR